MRKNSGFTLIEISIVIVIIGLLIAGVIQGKSLIQGAKVSNAITLAQDISVAVNAFKQQYHMLPGDMGITTEFPTLRTECLTGIKKGNNNGKIETGLSGSPDESSCVPEVLFLAGFAKQPTFSSYYGTVSVKASSTVAYLSASITAGTFPATHVVEFANLPCDVAHEMDRKMDNDDLASGKGIASDSGCIASTPISYAVAL